MKKECGQGLAEYLIILFFLAIVVFVAIGYLQGLKNEYKTKHGIENHNHWAIDIGWDAKTFYDYEYDCKKEILDTEFLAVCTKNNSTEEVFRKKTNRFEYVVQD